MATRVRVIHRRAHTVELVEAGLDPGGAGRARHARHVEFDAPNRLCVRRTDHGRGHRPPPYPTHCTLSESDGAVSEFHAAQGQNTRPWTVRTPSDPKVLTVTDADALTNLALAAGRGDRAALDEFIRATERDVWRTVAFLADPGTADDLTQETYLRVLGALPRFAGRSSARTWLLSIARRVVVDQIRRNQARPRTTSQVDLEGLFSGPPAGSGFEDIVEIRLLLDGPGTGPPGRTGPDAGPGPVLQRSRRGLRMPTGHHPFPGGPGP